MSVLILEDNLETQKILQKIVLSVSPRENIFLADKTAEAYKVAIETSIDVFMVDIILDMNKKGDTSGIKFAEKIRSMEKYQFTPLIFITSLEDPELYAYRDLHSFGYIEKPFSYKAVAELVEQALHYHTKKEDRATLFFRKDGILYPAKCSEICYMELVNKKMCINMESGDVLEIPYKSFKDILVEANYSKFLQCSRNSVVNIDYIENIDKTNRFISIKHSHKKIEIGLTFAKRVFKELGI